jgi:starch-binding outer membrane protein, SusD/RagB family
MKTKDKISNHIKPVGWLTFNLLLLIVILGTSSCAKYLDVKPDKALIVPTTIEDAQLVLNNYQEMNQYSMGYEETQCDDYTVPYSQWNTFYSAEDRGLYVWDKDIIYNSSAWYKYKTVLNANVAIGILDQIDPTIDNKQKEWNTVKGCALFFRATSFYEQAQKFAPAYDASTAEKDLGIPLRLTADIDIPTTRASVQQTYDQIIKDLNDAISLLPADNSSQHVSMPNKAAAYGLLARTYLMMRNYPLALENATNSLNLQSTLLDYKTISDFPSQFDNHEVSFLSMGNPAGFLYYFYGGEVNPDLYNSYAANDLRASLFFSLQDDGGYSIARSYSGTFQYGFTGVAVDEMYLTRAECYARAGNKSEALTDLNTLLRNRYDDTFIDLTAATNEDAVNLILKERRKELIYRNIRWSDLKRLNKEPEHAVTLTRTFPDNPSVTFTLPPNDLRYVMLIPKAVIDLTGIAQNPR